MKGTDQMEAARYSIEVGKGNKAFGTIVQYITLIQLEKWPPHFYKTTTTYMHTVI